TVIFESLVSAPAVVKVLPPEMTNVPWLVVRPLSAGKLAVGAPSVTLAPGAIVVTVLPTGKLSVPAFIVQLPPSDVPLRLATEVENVSAPPFTCTAGRLLLVPLMVNVPAPVLMSVPAPLKFPEKAVD